MAANPEIGGKGGTVTLPSGIAGKVIRWSGREEITERDNTGFTDGGYFNGKLTRQRFSGSVLIHINSGTVGTGTLLENVAMTLQVDTCRTITGNFNITGTEIVVDNGDIVAFTANFGSNGEYTNSGV